MVWSSAADLQLGPGGRSRVVPVGQPTLGQRDRARRAGPAARRAEDGDGIRLVGDAGEQLRELIEAADHRQRPPDVGADRETLEVPGDVLAEVGTAVALALLLAQQFGVPVHDPGDLTEGRQGPTRLPGERGGQIAEEPWAPEAAASDDHA